MRLIRAAGIASVEIDDDESTREALIDEAVRMRKAGIEWSPSDWIEMQPIEREALVEAGERYQAETAALIGGCVLNPDDRTLLYSKVDGGRSRDLLLLRRMMDRVGERLAGEVSE